MDEFMWAELWGVLALWLNNRYFKKAVCAQQINRITIDNTAESMAKNRDNFSIPALQDAEDALPTRKGERVLISQLDAQQSGGAQWSVVNLQRTGAATARVAEVQLEGAHIKAGNVAAGAMRAEVTIEEERTVVRKEIEFKDDGQVTLRQFDYTKQVFYREVAEIFYVAALNEPEEPPEPTRKKKMCGLLLPIIHLQFQENSKNT